MAKLFSKKSETETLRSLGEEEIQKKLYGRYHRPELKTSNSRRETATVETPEIKSLSSSNLLSSGPIKKNVSINWEFVSNALKKFPLKLFATVIGSVAIAIVLFQLMPSWFQKKETHVSEAVSVTSMPIEETVPQKQPEKLSLTQPVLKTTIEKVSPSSKKYYAVQVCTYQREEDARRLIKQLEILNFPAFFQKTSSSSGLSHYIVFLSKEESYAQANSKLSQFRKTKEFETFSDSFIRSL